MNKRQAKKAHKKVTYPIVDEMNLLTLTPEEYQKAIADYDAWVYKHCRYKHYKDKYKKISFFDYHFPVGKSMQEYYEKVIKTARKYEVNTTFVFKSLNDIKQQYPEELQKL